ncbi:MAG: hypothetical protein ABL963_12795 [Longimicrobiales bacterium]
MTEPERKPEPSWLDEISLATKLVFVVTVVSVMGYLIYLILDLFI